METTELSPNGGSLLTYVVSRLRPDVFTHPIWVHFGGKRKPISSEEIEVLLSAAKQLQKDDPGNACQILLICAVHQNYANQRDEALESMEQIMTLAERYALTDELLWAAWGAAAICVQRGDTEGAAEYLQKLQTRLWVQDEWVLANFVETVEQSLRQDGPASEGGEADSSPELEFSNLMHFTFDWLGQWGFLAQSSLPKFQANSRQSTHSDQLGTISSQPLASDRGWRRFWGRFKQIIRGELKLGWVANGAQRRTHQTRRDFQSSITYSSPPKPIQPKAIPFPAARTMTQEHTWSEPAASSRPQEASTGASLLIYCMGPFQVYQGEQEIDDWPSSKGKAVFKYLVTHHERPVLKDILMDLFWPDISAESARNNLNVAIYSLRQSLRKTNPSFSHVLFINDCYLLNPELRIWLDYESFLDIVTTAHKLDESSELEAAISAYSKAEALYQGEFLEEDRYEDWVLPLRRNLNEEYLNLLDHLSSYYEQIDFPTCMNYCRKMLAVDPCREDAHRRLMNGYYQHGHLHLAIRQYHICTDTLKRELDVAPSQETTALYQQIRIGSKE